MKQVKAKKHLGQHFLTDLNVAQKIADLLNPIPDNQRVLEVGPGMGVLTQFLYNNSHSLDLVEIDQESIDYLNERFPKLKNQIHYGDFLEMYIAKTLDLKEGEQISLIGNFPYNISSQIFFNVLDNRNLYYQVVGMLQKEVAERITSPPGNKTYGILSVLLQAYFDCEYSFSVPPQVFQPPPKVYSGVIKLKRNKNKELSCSYANFKTVVKMGFNQRRKILKNALSSILKPETEHPFLQLRAEQLSYKDFEELTNLIYT